MGHIGFCPQTLNRGCVGCCTLTKRMLQMQASWLPLLIQSKHCLYQTLLRGCQLVALQRNTWQDEMRFMPYFTLALHA